MATYFVSPPEPTDLRIDPVSLEAALRARWPNVSLKVSDDPASYEMVEWSIPMRFGMIQGYLSRDRDTVYIQGDVRDCAESAVWLRTQVPENYPLMFYDEGYTADVELRVETTAEQLSAPFLFA